MNGRIEPINLVLLAALTLAVAALSGCGKSEPEGAPSSSPVVPATPPPPPPPPLVAPNAPAPVAEKPAVPAKTPPAAAKKPAGPAKAAAPAKKPAAPAKAARKAPATVQKPAAVGAGQKGRGYGKGMVATPAATLFAVKERMVFEIKIPHALGLFKAAEGHAPKTHEEFMDKIIKANHIRLPALPQGHRYAYDPKQEQLMVEKPAP